MTKPNPFNYVKGINHKKYDEDLSGYNPFLTNKSFSMHLDTILLAEEMNQAHTLSPQLQYDFYYYSVRRGDRYGWPPKQEDQHHLELVMEYFEYSKQKAIEALQVLTLDDINDIIIHNNRGGQ